MFGFDNNRCSTVNSLALSCIAVATSISSTTSYKDAGRILSSNTPYVRNRDDYRGEEKD